MNNDLELAQTALGQGHDYPQGHKRSSFVQIILVKINEWSYSSGQNQSSVVQLNSL